MRPELVAQYQRLKPLEKNGALLELFLQLPTPLYDQFPNEDYWISTRGKGAGIDGKDRRRVSPERYGLLEKLDSLLIISHTTASFQTYVTYNYGEWYITGVDRSNVVMGPFAGILFENHSTNPGIFAPNTGKDIERRIYREHARELLEAAQNIERVAQEMGIDTNPYERVPDHLIAILHTNPNERFRNPENHGRELEAAELQSRQLRTSLANWPVLFFEKHQEEI